MGQSSSSINGGEDFTNVPTLGYRVLGVQPNSPASEAGLVSFFDFFVGANGRMLFHSCIDSNDDPDSMDDDEDAGIDVDFVGLLQENVGKPVELRKLQLYLKEWN